jgi:hypothetical protein
MVQQQDGADMSQKSYSIVQLENQPTVSVQNTPYGTLSELGWGCRAMLQGHNDEIDSSSKWAGQWDNHNVIMSMSLSLSLSMMQIDLTVR